MESFSCEGADTEAQTHAVVFMSKIILVLRSTPRSDQIKRKIIRLVHLKLYLVPNAKNQNKSAST